MSPKLFHRLILKLLKLFFLFIVVQALLVNSENQFSQSLLSLKGSRKGHIVEGLNQVKQYLKTFGYYPNHINNLTDHFDDILDTTLKTYQKYYRLQETGILDDDTMKQMLIPRCGLPDISITSNLDHRTIFNRDYVPNYSFFDGMPRWSKRQLTYAFRSSVHMFSDEKMRTVIDRAFQKWAAVTNFTFEEATTGTQADILIGFHRRDHGDNVPFDGPGNILAHGFQPEVGWLHFDAEETWVIGDHPLYTFKYQADLESVAVHEIGHILGLTHSQNPEAIMFPTIPSGTIKRDLRQDDIDGIRVLYYGHYY